MNLFPGITPFKKKEIEDLCWVAALSTVMSKTPETDPPIKAVDDFMEIEVDEIPEDYLVWQPFGNLWLADVQDQVSGFQAINLQLVSDAIKLANNK